MTESFGQLVIQGILLIRFDWLVKKDDFNSFGLNFQVFVIASMCVAFFTMLKAVLAYHNRNRESLRPVFSLSNLSTVAMFLFILVAKVIVYIVGFQNTPGLFFVPVVVKILASWILLNTFEPEFRSLLAHERLTCLCIISRAALYPLQRQEEDQDLRDIPLPSGGQCSQVARL